MAAFMPAWRPLDAAHSVRLLADRDRGGRVVALCLAPTLGSTPEGTRLAVALVRRWVEGGLDVVLADGDLGKPSLHTALGQENGTGLADLVLLGGAWEEAALSTPTPGLKLIPAGSGAAAAESHAARERLDELCRAVTAGGATLALFVPLGSMMAQWAVEAASDIVVLAQEQESPLDFFAFDEDRIRALVGPPTAPSASHGPPPGAGAPGARFNDRIPRPSPGAGAPSGGPPAAQERHVREEGRGTGGIEEKWAAAAALLRAQREASVGEPSAWAEPLFATPRSPRPEPSTRPEPPSANPPNLAWAAVPHHPAPVEPPPAEAPPPAIEPAAPPDPPVVPRAQVFRDPPVVPRAPAFRDPPVVPRAPAFRDILADEAGAGESDFPPLPEEYVPQRRSGKRPRRSGRTWSPEPPPAVDLPDPYEGEGFPPARRLLVRSLVAVAGVAITAGAVWIWNSSREMPPLDVRSTPLPRVGVPGQAAPPAAGGDLVPTGRQEPVDDAVEGAPAPDSLQDAARGAAPATATQPPPAALDAGRAPTPGVGESGAPLQRYSWSVAAMGSYDAARSLVERLRRSAPDRAFFIAPIMADGRTLYRVLGGVAESREALGALRDGVAAAAGVEPARLLLRDAPLAFALQDFSDAPAAAARADQLWRAGVPAYVLEVNRDDGTRIHRIHAGAYASAEEAAILVGTLRAAGFGDAPLVERRGRVGG